jgi:hypothetical protein
MLRLLECFRVKKSQSREMLRYRVRRGYWRAALLIVLCFRTKARALRRVTTIPESSSLPKEVFGSNSSRQRA